MKSGTVIILLFVINLQKLVLLVQYQNLTAYTIVVGLLFDAVNSHSSPENVSFTSVDEALKLLKPNSYMAKIDLASAYRHVPIHPSDYTAMGIKWKFRDSQKYTNMVDTRLPFVASKSVFIFSHGYRSWHQRVCLFSVILRRVLLGWPKKEEYQWCDILMTFLLWETHLNSARSLMI